MHAARPALRLKTELALRGGAGRAGVEQGAALCCTAGRWQLYQQASHTKPQCCTVQHATQQPQLPRPTCAAASFPLATGGSWWKSPDRMSCNAQGLGGWVDEAACKPIRRRARV